MNRFQVALEVKYQAEIEEAIAVLDLYFTKAVGVGEHPDVLSVMDEYVTKLETAKSKLDVLRQLFPQQQQQQPEPVKENN